MSVVSSRRGVKQTPEHIAKRVASLRRYYETHESSARGKVMLRGQACALRKRCACCGQEKDRKSFHADNRGMDGLQRVCKQCTSERDDGRSFARRASQLLKEYGITLKGYEDLLASQGGVCAICKNPPQLDQKYKNNRILHVDHCHDTGVVRGLLCHDCNRALGSFGDSLGRVQAAARYLEEAQLR